MADDDRKTRARGWEDVLLSGASEIARAGDRWFVSVFTDAAGAGRWARREADLIGDSMTAAFHTTVDVAKKMRPGGSTEEVAPPAPPPEARPANIDVLAALNQVGVPAQASESALASHPAGIAPLLAALEEVVSSRAADGYESLQSDERFWALVELIHQHNERVAESEGSG